MDSGIFNYIDFFSGCGGLSLGLGSSGWNGVFAIEIDPMAFQTFKHNLIDSKSIRHHFDSWPEWLSVEPHAIEDVLEDPSIRSNLLSLSGKIMLVAGGPPCQGFSVAGARNGKDPRNLLVFKQIEAIKILKPSFVIIENVGGFEKRFVSRPSDDRTISVAEEALNELIKAGYNVGKVRVNAANCGVPQVRHRVILFGISKELLPDVNAAELFEDTLAKVAIEQRQELGLAVDRYVNVKEAISDLAGDETVSDPEFPNYKTCRYLKVESAYQELMRKNVSSLEIPTSHRFNKHSAKIIDLIKLAQKTQLPGRLSKDFLYENNCHSNKRYVLDTTIPSSTLTTAPDELFHYKQPRIVTLREMARLQSFPDDFSFYGRYTLNGPSRGIDVPRNAQIGNAIPPLVGRAFGKAIMEIHQKIQVNDSSLQQYIHNQTSIFH